MSETKTPLLFKEDSVNGESRVLDISLRGWIALLVVATLCAIVLVISIRVREIEQVLPALKDLFLPTVSTIIVFYFATKPNNPNPPPARPGLPPMAGSAPPSTS